MEGGAFKPYPPAGCVFPSPGFPTLYSLPTTHARRAVRAHVFNRPSGKESMVLTLQEVEGGPEENAVTASAPPSADDAVLTPTERHLKAAFGVQYAPLRGHSASLWGEYDAAGRASSLLGSVVHVRWPHLDQGIVVSISDATKEVVWLPPAGYDFVGTPKFDTPGRPASREVRHSVQAQHVWSHDARHAQELALSGGLNLAICGIDIGPGEAGCVFSCTHDVGCSRLRCWLLVVTCTHTQQWSC